MYLADLTTSLTNVVTSVYTYTSLVGIVLAMALESRCIPLPSEIDGVGKFVAIIHFQ